MFFTSFPFRTLLHTANEYSKRFQLLTIMLFSLYFFCIIANAESGKRSVQKKQPKKIMANFSSWVHLTFFLGFVVGSFFFVFRVSSFVALLESFKITMYISLGLLFCCGKSHVIYVVLCEATMKHLERKNKELQRNIRTERRKSE